MCASCLAEMCTTTVAPTKAPTKAPPKSKAKKKKKKLSDGDKTAIAIGVVFFVILIVVMACAFCKPSEHYAMTPNDNAAENLIQNQGYMM